MLKVGERLNHYKILDRLGEGGMGEVFRARDSRLGREVAIKVLPERFASEKAALGRFEREARALAALSHPNILTIFDFGNESGVCYTVMELLKGETLRERIRRKPLTADEALKMAQAIAEGLSAAHSKGITHRDIKPSNIFITTDEVVKILDFGLARVEKKAKGDDPDTASHYSVETVPGKMIGTVPYMSPEQVIGDLADARSDIFALGCVLYEMISGKRPFYHSNPRETMAAILTDEPPELPRAICPPEVQSIIKRCLQKDRNKRYQSAAELLTAIKLATRDQSLTLSAINIKAPQLNRRIYLIVLPLLLLTILAGTLYKLYGSNDRSYRSLGILPFENVDNDSTQEYLSDGITEGVIDSMSRLSKVRVMARSTVFRYKGRKVDAQTAGREMKVDAVLTGRVFQQSDTVTVKLELVDTYDGSQLWTNQYTCKSSEVIALQEQIATDISDRLGLKLTGDDVKRMTKRDTQNNEALSLYMKGRFYWNKRKPEFILKGLEHFKQAIDIDPNFALAYSGLADSYNVLGGLGVLAPDDSFPMARNAAAKAMELDNSRAEAHASLAHVLTFYYWDWDEAEREYKRAIELNPEYATAHQWYGLHLAAMGRMEEAIKEFKIAQHLDPLSLVISAQAGLPYYYKGEYDRAIEQYKKTLDMDPTFAPALAFLSWAYEKKGEFDQAIALGEKVKKDESTWIQAGLGHSYAIAGKKSEAQQVINDLNNTARRTYVSAFAFANVYVGMGDKDRTIEWLEKAYRERSGLLIFIKVDPRWDSIRDDARFQALLREMKLS